MKTIGLSILLLAFCVSSSFGQRSENPPPPVLVVTGSAQVFATPDEAVVRLGVVRQAPAAQQVQTSRLVLTPVYAPRGPEARDAPRIVAYSASNVVTVRLDNLSLTGPV